MIDEAMVKAASNSAAIPGLTWRIATSKIMLFLLFYCLRPQALAILRNLTVRFG
jgi:ribulose-5-phosphate 4-epimerase/fuculose-1-phosphate aldolase